MTLVWGAVGLRGDVCQGFLGSKQRGAKKRAAICHGPMRRSRTAVLPDITH